MPVVLPTEEQSISSRKVEALMERMNKESVIVDDPEETSEYILRKRNNI